MTLSVAIAGCTGRMGLTLVEACHTLDGVSLVAGSEKPGFDANAVKARLAPLGYGDLPITSDPEELAQKATAIIDFTSPKATLAVTRSVAAQKGIHVIGTTGFTVDEQKELEQYASSARIVQANNFSLGVNILSMLVEQTARILDERYDIELFEIHHKHKKDAPSGTALMLGNAAARGRNVSLEDRKVTARDGITGERKQGDIGFSVMRGGDVVGEHDVMFAGPGEIITLKHQGFSRSIYANGALHAVQWAQDKPAGHYSMQDVLGL